MPVDGSIPVYIESGRKRTFAGALEWPGWCRSGAGENEALKALFAAGPRYARAMRAGRVEFRSAASVADFRVVERLEGNQTTDFGAPDTAPAADGLPIESDELGRLQNILRCCWGALDAAAASAAGRELRLGPRGGGRSLEGILEHVLGGDAAYLSKLAWRYKALDRGDIQGELVRTRQASLEALTMAIEQGVPERGPRGGWNWKPRFFIRRMAWHCLDHAWEIEDRMI